MKQAPPKWFRQAIGDGLVYLVSLSLPNTPSHETIKLTKAAWAECLFEGRAWVEEDATRIAASFRSMSRKVDRWPAPRVLLEHLPARPQRRALPGPEISEEQRRRNLRKISAMLRGALKEMPS